MEWKLLRPHGLPASKETSLTHTPNRPLCLSNSTLPLKTANCIKSCEHSNKYFLDCLSTEGQVLLTLSSPFTFISVPLEESCKCTQTAELALCKSEVVVILTWLMYVTSERVSWTISVLFASFANLILTHTYIHTYICVCIMHALELTIIRKMQFIYKPALRDSKILAANPLNSQVTWVERSLFLTQYHKCITLETAIMEANPITTMAATKFLIRTSVSQALKKYVSEELHCFQKIHWNILYKNIGITLMNLNL